MVERELEALAPRLCAAYRARRREVAWRLERHDEILRLEALVEHRDLQLQRAHATGNRRYIARRHAKLLVAQTWLTAARRRLDAGYDERPTRHG